MRLRGHLLRVVIATLVPAFVFSGAIALVLVEREQAAQRQGMLSLAKAVGAAIDAQFSRTVDTLRLLAADEALQRGDFTAFEVKMRAARATNPLLTNIAVLHADGTVARHLNSTTGNEPAPGERSKAEFRRALEAREAVFTPVLRSALTGRPYLAVAYPVFLAGGPPLILVATHDYSSWTALLAAQTPPGWITAIDDRGGTIAGRSEEADTFAGKPASQEMIERYTRGEPLFEITNRVGVKVAGAFHPIASGGARVLVLAPASLLNASVRSTQILLAMGFLATLLAAAGAFWHTLRPATRGLAALSSAVRGVPEGKPLPEEHNEIVEIDQALLDARRAAFAVREREERLLAMSRELESRAQFAEESSRAKSRFLAMLSHELRNPLGAISNSLAVLERAPLADSWKSPLAIAKRQTAHLAGLIEDLLDVSRLEAGKVRLKVEPLDLAEIVRDAIDAARAARRLQSHRVEIELAPVGVSGDRLHPSQVVANLLDNALKFTPAGGTIRIVLRAAPGTAELTVQDSGQGIEASLLARIFQPFEQAEQGSDRARGGLGLGLAIAQRLVLLHGGTIEAKSEGPGRGSVFTVTLPSASVVERAA